MMIGYDDIFCHPIPKKCHISSVIRCTFSVAAAHAAVAPVGGVELGGAAGGRPRRRLLLLLRRHGRRRRRRRRRRILLRQCPERHFQNLFFTSALLSKWHQSVLESKGSMLPKCQTKASRSMRHLVRNWVNPIHID